MHVSHAISQHGSAFREARLSPPQAQQRVKLAVGAEAQATVREIEVMRMPQLRRGRPKERGPR
eukprot:scaffold7400_cov100-Isochrysis_galbana.AAC.2